MESVHFFWEDTKVYNNNINIEFFRPSVSFKDSLSSSKETKHFSLNFVLMLTKLGCYHDIIEYRDINLETISISDGFGFNRNIDISRYIAIYRDISRYIMIIAIYRNID